MKHNFKVEKSGIRLDKFLVENLEGCSRQKAREACEERIAVVNGRFAKPGSMLNEGDTVTVDDGFLEVGASAQNWPAEEALNVLFEDAFFVAVHKPRGMHCVRLRHDDAPTVSDFLSSAFPETTDASADSRESGLVQRLDHWTSGAIVAAKRRESHDALRNVFKEDLAAKSYLAIVEGKFLGERNNSCFLYAKPGAKTVRCFEEEDDRENLWKAQALVSGLAYDPETNSSLVRLKMHSAKRHQVRAQLAFDGFPLVGDRQYGSTMTLADINIPEDGFLLLAESISFQHPLKKGAIFVGSMDPLILDFASRCGVEI